MVEGRLATIKLQKQNLEVLGKGGKKKQLKTLCLAGFEFNLLLLLKANGFFSFFLVSLL